MSDPYDWSKSELAAYKALEQARSGIDIGTVLKNLGHYNQAAVDTANAVKKTADKGKRKKRRK